MNAETIREWLNRRPFEPFELRLSNGETYRVRHPETIAIGKTRIAVASLETDQITHIALIHINSISATQAA
ncbi:MAG: hypothetical protein FJ297_10940 [Planctomycetes bacterium]|nr:hypothetical protein [Planctomycetota bacterium]